MSVVKVEGGGYSVEVVCVPDGGNVFVGVPGKKCFKARCGERMLLWQLTEKLGFRDGEFNEEFMQVLGRTLNSVAGGEMVLVGEGLF